MAGNLIRPPTSSDPIAGGLLVSPVWYKFFMVIANLVQVLGPGAATGAVYPTSVASGLTATGTTQGTALSLNVSCNEVITTPANSGVMAYFQGLGSQCTVYNQGANALKVYPPVGGQIDALGTNNPYSLAAGKCQVFTQLTSTKIRSTQLG